MKRSRLSWRYQRALLKRIFSNWRSPRVVASGLFYAVRGDMNLIAARMLRILAGLLRDIGGALQEGGAR